MCEINNKNNIIEETVLIDFDRLAKYTYKQDKNNTINTKLVCGKNMLKYLEKAIDKQNKEVRRT